jgi:mannose-6-phosphate isomerase-like protein (cupin superfamily)
MYAESEMTQPTRRVVTGHDDQGKAVVLIDGPAPNVKVRAASRLISTLLWVSDETPADVSGDTDQAVRTIGVAPPSNGSILRVVDFPPATAGVAEVDHAQVLREMGLPEEPAPPRHTFTHRTRSLDYAIVLTGEIDMLLDDSQVHLKAGDVLVQQGTNHAWVNNGTQTCRIAFVLIDAQEPPAWKRRVEVDATQG